MTTVSVKGQVVIPLEFRKKYGLTPGAEVKFTEQQGQLILSARTVQKNNDFSKALEEWDKLPASPIVSTPDDDKAFLHDRAWRKYESLSD